MSLHRASCTLFAALACLPLAGGCKEERSPSITATGGAASRGENTASQAAGSSATDSNQPGESPAAASPSAPADDSKPKEAPPSNEVAAADASPAEAASDAQPPATADITFDDIKFDIQPDAPFKRDMLTKKIEDLSGKPVRIRGYILPSFQQTGLTQFVLVRDNQACCFGPGAALYDCIVVEMKPGKSTDFNLYPVAVEGTFSIREFQDPDGKALAIYHLDGDEVR